jgi:hypothetical protein
MNNNRRRRRDDASADVADRPIDGTPDYVERVKAVLPHLNRASHVDAHFKSRRHAGTQIARIVIHDTGSGNRSTFRDSQRYLAHPQDGRDVSIHYLIGREEGEFVSMVPEDMVANHAHGNNRDTIGIELFRRGNETRDFSDWQYETVAQLIFDLRFRYAIGRNRMDSIGRDWTISWKPSRRRPRRSTRCSCCPFPERIGIGFSEKT